MKKRLAVLAVVPALFLAAAAPNSSQATVDDRVTLVPGESVTIVGELVPPGANPLYYNLPQAGTGGHGTCTAEIDKYCQHVLVRYVNPVDEDDEDGRIDGFSTVALRTSGVDGQDLPADYDLEVYASDAAGTVGDELGSSAAYPLGDFSENVSLTITTTREMPEVYVLVRIIYYAPTMQHRTTISF